jgi:hypothetical protein
MHPEHGRRVRGKHPPTALPSRIASSIWSVIRSRREASRQSRPRISRSVFASSRNFADSANTGEDQTMSGGSVGFGNRVGLFGPRIVGHPPRLRVTIPFAIRAAQWAPGRTGALGDSLPSSVSERNARPLARGSALTFRKRPEWTTAPPDQPREPARGDSNTDGAGANLPSAVPPPDSPEALTHGSALLIHGVKAASPEEFEKVKQRGRVERLRTAID